MMCGLGLVHEILENLDLSLHLELWDSKDLTSYKLHCIESLLAYIFSLKLNTIMSLEIVLKI